MLTIQCDRCGRRGIYQLAPMDPDMRLTDFLARVTEDCLHRKEPGALARCDARFIRL